MEPQVKKEEGREVTYDKPPYQYMTCATCLHLAEHNACLALPPMPVLKEMKTAQMPAALLALSGQNPKTRQLQTSMLYTAVYPQITKPEEFRACSLYVQDPRKVTEIMASAD